jgi:predicted nuclease of predicted toxin-antitoxin system
MLFKLDENLPPSWGGPACGPARHGVASAADEGLQGAGDDEVIEAARSEERCLVTADEDFTQLINYPAGRYSGSSSFVTRDSVWLERRGF